MPKARVIPLSALPRSAGVAIARPEPPAVHVYAEAVAAARDNLIMLRDAGPDQALLITLEGDETEHLVKQHYRDAARQLGLTVGFSRQATRIRDGKSEVGELAVVLT